MTNLGIQRKSFLPIISGILLSFCAFETILRIIRCYNMLLDFDLIDFRLYYTKIIITNSISVILLLALAVSLFVQKPIFSGISLSGLAVLNLYFAVGNILSGVQIIWIIESFLCVYAFAFAAVIFFLAKSGKPFIKSVWFIPAILLFLGSIHSILDEVFFTFSYYSVSDISEFFFGSKSSDYFDTITYALGFIAQVVGLLLMCMWICVKNRNTVATPYFQPTYQNVPVPPMPCTPQTIYAPMPQANQAYQVVQQPQGYDAATIESELTTLKNLLDNGIITNEEFEIKKKQILGI